MLAWLLVVGFLGQSAGCGCQQSSSSGCDASQRCATDRDCTSSSGAGCGPGNPCRIQTCSAGRCASDNAANGPASEQTAGDCKKAVCNSGLVTSIPDLSDPPAHSSWNPCLTAICSEYGVSSGVWVTDGTPCPGGFCRGGRCGPLDGGHDVDTGAPKPEPSDGTVGKPCSTDDDCDITGAGVNHCTNALFTAGTLYPDAVCFGIMCDPVDGPDCDDAHGVCVPMSSGAAYCFPRCGYDGESGAAPSGCVGKDICTPYSWSKSAASSDAGADATDSSDSVDADADGETSSTKIVGLGLCFGGCHADSDCTKGDRCQLETGLCVKALKVYTKLLGDPCTFVDDITIPEPCNCLFTLATKKGYCSAVCKVGDSTWGCPSGFTCDPGLPRVDPKTGDTVFSKAPFGIQGNCLVNCATDADCVTLGGYCEEMAGTGQATCQIGKRP